MTDHPIHPFDYTAETIQNIGQYRLVQPVCALLAAIQHPGRRFLCRGSRGGSQEGQAPNTFNTDQGTQFTSETFTGLLEQHGVKVSFHNTERPHQIHGYRTPAEVYISTPVESTSKVW